MYPRVYMSRLVKGVCKSVNRVASNLIFPFCIAIDLSKLFGYWALRIKLLQLIDNKIELVASVGLCVHAILKGA